MTFVLNKIIIDSLNFDMINLIRKMEFWYESNCGFRYVLLVKKQWNIEIINIIYYR